MSYDGGRTSDALLEHSGRRDLHAQRRHGGSVQHLRGPSGSRALAAVRRHGRSGRVDDLRLVRDRQRRRHRRARRPDGQSLALHDARVRQSHARSIRSSATRRRSAATAEPAQPPYRFLWEPPLVISPHNSNTIYAGAQVLLRSDDRGDHWTEISPDLSTNPADKILPRVRGRRAGRHSVVRDLVDLRVADDRRRDLGGHERRQSAGHARRRRDWTDVTAAITRAGGREDAYVSRVRASSHVAGPRVRRRRAATSSTTSIRTSIEPTTIGATWTSIAGNLPNEPINVIREDSKNPESALRRQRRRRVRLDRSRRALGEDEQQHAERRRARSARASARAAISSSARTRAISGSRTSRR